MYLKRVIGCIDRLISNCTDQLVTAGSTQDCSFFAFAEFVDTEETASRFNGGA
jgi:hypothetical protein